MRSIGSISTAICLAISVTADGLFLLATSAGDYTLVERLGGVGWVFLLSMIILLPIVTPLVKRKRGM